RSHGRPRLRRACGAADRTARNRPYGDADQRQLLPCSGKQRAAGRETRRRRPALRPRTVPRAAEECRRYADVPLLRVDRRAHPLYCCNITVWRSPPMKHALLVALPLLALATPTLAAEQKYTVTGFEALSVS